MTPEQEALREKVADAIGDVWDCPEEDDDRLRVYASAAIAVVLKEAARVAETCTLPKFSGKPVSYHIAAAILSLIPQVNVIPPYEAGIPPARG